MNWLLAILQTILFVALAPLLAGWIKCCKCRLQNRKAPSLFQPYRDLLKLTRKQPVISDQASWIFTTSPYIIFSAMVLAASIVPLVAVDLPTSANADVIVLIGFFSFARFFLALAGLDVGTAFGGMGSSREMTISSMAEPAMLMGIFALTMSASTTNLSFAIDHVLDEGLVLRPSFIFALLSLMLVAIAETGRIPVDNPATHLELTMIHEAMILEYSGRHLALIEWASQLKLMLYGVLIANIFFPWGIAKTMMPADLSYGLLAIMGKLALLAILLALSETLFAKMRLFRVQEFLSFAYLLGLLGMLSHIILEGAR
ncbi:respiratory chain complex I subunit 1 family protein [Methylobacter sp. YRD-M1]|uniref:respiratory chain complex I subunit 1 family protein n=1 Tax=Methylobacter sp. YRD-M1 TaxID=2911520 RepID=UPI00227D4A0C|nr:NADH-quinone oxidoreductase subunit H [Methylobacter sp. YRD-M1]WAK04046.1 NADH-quinone oxidoreductase subunit H [Methylobacter sp. YRD-M1]